MQPLRFYKYSLNGNTFVFVDETQGPQLSENQKSEFAYRAANSYFGIGADNLILLQPSTQSILDKINSIRNYWGCPPKAGEADFIFRMFEPDGTEAFSCGNGLTCIANHLHRHYSLDRARIMTQVPLEIPQVLTVGADTANHMNWTNLGQARRVPGFMVQTPTEPINGKPLERIEKLKVSFSEVHPEHPTRTPPLDLNGYLVFTGEPHLVFLADGNFPDPHIAAALFASGNGKKTGEASADLRRGSYNSWLVHYIGTYINRTYKQFFPCGINVNFMHVTEMGDAIEYRCFERGIYHETLACGTGAVAVSAVIRHLGLYPGDTYTLHPHRCRWYKPDAEFIVRHTENGWYLYGRPDLLYKGDFPWQPEQLGTNQMERTLMPPGQPHTSQRVAAHEH